MKNIHITPTDNPKCDCSEQDIDCQCLGYKIIIPKQEQKQMLSEMMQEDEKLGLYDDSVEQAAKNFYPVETTDLICSPKWVRKAFIVGAEWQKKQMYSKEEVIKLLKGMRVVCTFGSSEEIEDYINNIKK